MGRNLAIMVAATTWLLLASDASGQDSGDALPPGPVRTNSARSQSFDRNQRYDSHPVQQARAAYREDWSLLEMPPEPPFADDPRGLAGRADHWMESIDRADENLNGPGCECCPQDRGRCNPCSPCFVAGFACTFLQPHFGDNVAFTKTASDDATFSNISPTQFQYGLVAGPRVWLEYVQPDALGARVRYWQFNQAAASVAGTPPANGFGTLQAPTFGNVSISTTVPGEVMSAASGLELNALDLEGTKRVSFGRWSLAASAGVRYGSIKQNYQNQLRNVNGALQDAINFIHNFDGVGPTFAFEARRWLGQELSVFSTMRGSLLFGNRRTTLDAGEDLDLSTPFLTHERNVRGATLPIAELQLGLDWKHRISPSCTFFGQIAMEAQWWQGVGSAATEMGDLGLFGFNTALGLAF